MTDLLQKIIQNLFQIHSLESTTNFEFLKMVHHKPRNGKICFWFDKKYPWLTGKDGFKKSLTLRCPAYSMKMSCLHYTLTPVHMRDLCNIVYEILI